MTYRHPISAMASAIKEILDSEKDGFRKLESMPSLESRTELARKIAVMTQQSIDNVLEIGGWTRKEFNEAIRQATTERWAFNSNLILEEPPNVNTNEDRVQ